MSEHTTAVHGLLRVQASLPRGRTIEAFVENEVAGRALVDLLRHTTTPIRQVRLLDASGQHTLLVAGEDTF